MMIAEVELFPDLAWYFFEMGSGQRKKDHKDIPYPNKCRRAYSRSLMSKSR
jgi:hypothetical protein